jgi:hypothetical protein
LIANQLGTDQNSIDLNYYPLYWSLTFFPGQGKTSIGMLLQDAHPAFDHFPTSFHSDWQWEAIIKGSKGFILNDTPKAYKPIAQIVDDFHRNNKEGAIFEYKVGSGKLLICGFDIANNESPVANQLKYSLVEYIKSSAFQPTLKVEGQYLKTLFPLIPKANYSAVGGDFKNMLLHVNAAKNLTIDNTNVTWTEDIDQVAVKKENVTYSVKSDGVWKDGDLTAWHGEKITITLECPSGILGSFYALFDDWNHQGREGFIDFEGRKVKLTKHDSEGGKWVKFHVMREDSNDGKLILKTTASKGDNLLIREIVLEKE